MALQPKETLQRSLFDNSEMQAHSDALMTVMDAINRKMGKGSVTTAASGIQHRWGMKRELASQNFTTDWRELPEAR